MKSEWKLVRVGDIVEFNYGKSLTANTRVDGDIPVYSSAGQTGWHNKPLVNSKGIVIGRKGTVGKVYKSDVPFFAIDTAYFVVPKDEVYNFEYMYYLLGSLGFESLNEDSAVPGLNRNTAYSQEFRLPPLPIQKKIAHILSTLDDKIELNRKMNQTLEQMAQAIFKSWFVDFDPVYARAKCSTDAELEAAAKELGISKEILELFPDELEESEFGMIPKGWKTESIAKHIKIIKGVSYKSSELQESKISLVTLKSFLRGGGYRTDGLKQYVGSYKEEQVIKAGEMVIAYTDVTQAADVIGKPAIVLSDEEVDTFVASLDVGIVRTVTDRVNLMFLYQLFLTAQFQGYILGHTSGTTVLHLNKSWLEFFNVPIPPQNIMQEFEKITKPLFYKFNENVKQIKTLQKTRDVLLPKLLSGEIEI